MKVRISRAALDAIVAHTQAAGQEECCGLLLGAQDGPADRVTAIQPAPNVAAEPRTRFEIDPAVLLAAHKAARDDGPAILGCYHSHPTGDPAPSREDAAQADAGGALWLICAGSPLVVTAWRAVPEGLVYGRFDPVEIDTTLAP